MHLLPSPRNSSPPLLSIKMPKHSNVLILLLLLLGLRLGNLRRAAPRSTTFLPLSSRRPGTTSRSSVGAFLSSPRSRRRWTLATTRRALVSVVLFAGAASGFLGFGSFLEFRGGQLIAAGCVGGG